MTTWAWLLVVYVAYLAGFGVGKHEKEIGFWLKALGWVE